MTETMVDRERRAGVGEVLLDVRDLRTHFHVMDGTVKAVDGVSFSIRRGGRLALVGESGCGKSVTALSIMRLIETPPGEFAGGQILFEGVDLLSVGDRQMRKVRGGEIAMIFQEPMTSLNPVMTVGDQIMEAVLLHQKVNRKGAEEIALSALKDVGVADPTRRLKQYPHEMSGGMRQRIMIAMALSCNPKLIIADEPTTALDVTIQRQILELIKSIQEKTGAALLLITHDLGRRRGGHVCRPGRGDRDRRGGPAPSADALHPRPAGIDPIAGQARSAPVGDQGNGPEPVPDAARLQVRAALPVRLGDVRGVRARPDPDRPGPDRPLLAERPTVPVSAQRLCGQQT
jgi:ABC-type dipeptide/oligopeptide/nickel transport system ATPase subunit